MATIMIRESIALEVPSTFSWSCNPKIGLSLFLFLISDVNLRELCGGDSSFLSRYQLIASMRNINCDLELEDSKVLLETISEFAPSILV